MCGSREVIWGPPPPPGKSQVIWVSIEITHWTHPLPDGKSCPPPLEKVGPPLKPLKIIIFFEITIEHPM